MNDVWSELAAAWLPYMGDDAEKLVLRGWVSDGTGRPHAPALYDEDDAPLPRRPRRTGSGERTELSRLESELTLLTGSRLGDLHRSASRAGEVPPPNWFEMTLWRDGRHEASFTYSAEAEKDYAPRGGASESPPDRSSGERPAPTRE